MGTRPRPQLRAPAGVQQWRAGQARRAGRARTDPGRAREYGWPRDRQLIVDEVLAAARDGQAAAEDPDNPPLITGL